MAAKLRSYMQSICTSASKTVSRIPIIRLENETDDFQDVALVAFMYLIIFTLGEFVFSPSPLYLGLLGPRHQIPYDGNHRASFGTNLCGECIGTFLLQ